MSAYLVDTNVVSELTKTVPDPMVIKFLSEYQELWLCSVVLHELEFGVQCLPQGHRRDQLRQILSEFIAEFAERILPLEHTEANWAAHLRAEAQRTGRVLHLGDALIAGTAKAHNLALATRNVTDFEGLDINVVNPWQMQ